MANSSPKAQADSNRYWLFIGASAGGLDAIKEFLNHFNDFANTHIVIAQHLDPKHPTILKDLLGRITDTPITLVTEDIEAEIGHIYIISPGHNAKINKNKIELSPAAEIGPKPSIDLLLKSAANSLAEQAIAIILSGTGTDGAQGTVDIKAANGLVFAQDSQSAKYSGMPIAATNTGSIDMVLPPKKIAEQVSYFIKNSHLQFAQTDLDKAQPALEKIFSIIEERTGYDFHGYKHKTINRRIARRMIVNKIEKIEDYIVLLQSTKTEVDYLYKDLLISVTDFFRDTSHFEALGKVIEDRVEKSNGQETMRIWVPGCANGPEAFSIAFLFYQACIKFNKDINFQVFATDIDENALNMARKAYYSAAQIENVKPELISRFFTEKNGHYLVSKKIRERVLFAKHNLVMDPPFSKIDMISCRNLLIYFAPDLQKEIFHTFHFALKNEGVLFLGKSESPVNISPELFDNYIKRTPIYIRKKVNVNSITDKVQSANNFARQKRKSPAIAELDTQQKITEFPKNSLESQMFMSIIPAAIIVDSSGEIIHLKGSVNEYLSFPQGKINMNVLTLIREDLKVDLRVLLNKAEKEGRVCSPVIFSNESDINHSLIISINRLNENPDDANFFSIGFLPIELGNLFQQSDNTQDVSVSEQELNKYLRQEVESFKDRLQTTVEELELTNEELQSTNEELQSANEELQSANEELQTSNEELQSTNQELSTVNQELEIKTYELEQANQDIESMLLNMNEAVIMIDNRLRLMRWTRVAEKLMHLDITHVNQTITTVGLPVDIPGLRQHILEVIETGETHSMRLRNQDKVYNLRFQPHHTENNVLLGVLMFFDEPQAEAKRVGLEIDCHKNFEILNNHVEHGFFVIDFDGTVTFVNNKACDLLGCKPKDLRYKSVDLFFPDTFAGDFLQKVNDDKSYLHSWREYTVQNTQQERLLCELRIEDTWVNSERHYIIFIRLK